MENKIHNDNEDIIIEDADLEDSLVEEVVKKPLSKNAHAKKLIDDSRELISKVDNELYEAKDIVSKNVSALKEAKAELTNATIAKTRTLLERVNHPYVDEDDFEPFEVELGTASESISVKNVSSGWFSGLILAIIGMIGTALAWLFVSTKVTGEVIPFDKIPTKEFLLEKMQDEKLFSWIGDNPQIGMAVMGVTTLLVGFLLYKVRVSMKANKNIENASSTFEQSNIYVSSQKESKSEILKVDEHIKVVTPLLGNYKAILDEQNAKLERIIHIEGELENNSDYQRTSKEVMSDTEKLMESVERLISIPVTQEGRLNEMSQNALIDTKVVYESYLSKLYA